MSSWAWKIGFALIVLHGCLLFYLGSIFLLAGDFTWSNGLLLFLLPLSLLGIRKPIAASISLCLFAAVAVACAFVPLTPDPVGPAVPDQFGFIRDTALFVALPALAAAAGFQRSSFRSKAKESAVIPPSPQRR